MKSYFNDPSNEKDKNKIELLESRFLNEIYKFSTKIVSPPLIIEKNLIGQNAWAKIKRNERFSKNKI